MPTIPSAGSLLFAAALTLFAATASAQHAGDILLSVPEPGGKLVTSGGDFTGEFAGRVFEGVMPPSLPYEIDAPGFDSLTGTFSAGDEIRFDFARELLYWNGSSLATPAGRMTVSYGPSKQASVGGTDFEGLSGYVISAADSNGAFHKHPFFSLPDTAADGVYGLTLTLGPGDGTSGFTTSDPFLITMLVGNPGDYTAGVAALADAAFAAPVPEPAAGLLAAAAAVLAGARCGRRRRGTA